MARLLEVIDRNEIEEYSRTLAYQEAEQAKKWADQKTPDKIIFVEHQPVYTVGRGVERQIPTLPIAQNISWYEVGRGGEATFHGPGQLVAYPIFDLNNYGCDLHVYLRKIEEAIISCLARFEVSGFCREGLTGVWVLDSRGNQKKIASIGVGVRRWISMHGLGLNVTTDLDYFRAISPCGQEGSIMTSLAEILKQQKKRVPTMIEVKKALTYGFCEAFKFDAVISDLLHTNARPYWVKAKAPGSPEYEATEALVRKYRLNTVCQEAHCPNVGECWSHRTATFMILGEQCTRRCSFCAIKDGTLESIAPLDPTEPLRTGKAVAELGLRHAVITSVTRDDLEDMGAAHFNQTVKAIKHNSPECAVELLIPDMQGERDLLAKILEGNMVDVLNHNLETVSRLYRQVRPGANYERSLIILKWAKELSPNVLTKSGIMVGLGETKDEILEVMNHLRNVDCDILTIGQYLQPTDKQRPIQRYVTPEEFDFYYREGLAYGFKFVESGALVRSSYHAWKHSQNVQKDSSRIAVAHEG